MDNNQDTQREEMAANAEAMLKYSQDMLQEAMGICQVNGPPVVELAIPDVLSGTNGGPPVMNQDDVWEQVTKMYGVQSSLYSGEEQPQATEAQEADTSESTQLADISKMLGA